MFRGDKLLLLLFRISDFYSSFILIDELIFFYLLNKGLLKIFKEGYLKEKKRNRRNLYFLI